MHHWRHEYYGLSDLVALLLRRTLHKVMSSGGAAGAGTIEVVKRPGLLHSVNNAPLIDRAAWCTDGVFTLGVVAGNIVE